MMQELISRKRFGPVIFLLQQLLGKNHLKNFIEKMKKTDMDRFIDLGIVKSELNTNTIQLNDFLNQLELLKKRAWQKEEMVKLFQSLLPEFKHIEKERSLDQKM